MAHLCDIDMTFGIEEDRAHTFSVRSKRLRLQRKGSDVGAQDLDGAQHPGGGLQGGEGWTGWGGALQAIARSSPARGARMDGGGKGGRRATGKQRVRKEGK